MPSDLQFMLGELNAKIDLLLQRTAEDRKHVEKLSARIAKLEAWRWVLTGASIVLSGGTSYLVKLFSH